MPDTLPALPDKVTIDLPTGTLVLEGVDPARVADLCDFAARANPKGGTCRRLRKPCAKPPMCSRRESRAICQPLSCSAGWRRPRPVLRRPYGRHGEVVMRQ
jgi:hypothetical protein